MPVSLAPPLGQERLRRLSDGRVVVELKRAWADGTTPLPSRRGIDRGSVALGVTKQDVQRQPRRRGEHEPFGLSLAADYSWRFAVEATSIRQLTAAV